MSSVVKWISCEAVVLRADRACLGHTQTCVVACLCTSALIMGLICACFFCRTDREMRGFRAIQTLSFVVVDPTAGALYVHRYVEHAATFFTIAADVCMYARV